MNTSLESKYENDGDVIDLTTYFCIYYFANVAYNYTAKTNVFYFFC